MASFHFCIMLLRKGRGWPGFTRKWNRVKLLMRITRSSAKGRGYEKAMEAGTAALF